MKWCRSCVLPDTRPNLSIGPDGVCSACRNHGTKRSIDWDERAATLEAVCAAAKKAARANGWDCVIPVSGGKDSTWQTIKCLEAGLKPLAVTWHPPGRTALGQANLENLIRLGVDHIDWTLNPHVEARFTMRSFERFGSTAIPMHMAIHHIPLTVAARFGIPLIVWGENSAFEYGGEDEAQMGFRLDAHWLKDYGVTHGTTAADWVSEDLSAKDLAAYFGPGETELEAADVRAIFLGYYLPWDPDETRRVAEAHGFRADISGPRTGFYDFADIDDDFIAIHHWMKWYKFGFTRLFDNLSLEIRNGRMTREQALKIITDAGEQRPDADIAKFCAFAKISQDEFFGIAERFRNPEIWKQCDDGTWQIAGFPIENWKWQ